MMQLTPTTQEARRLFHEGTIALSMAECAGMRVDVTLLEYNIEGLEKRVKSFHQMIKSDPNVSAWVGKRGTVFSPVSDANVGHFLYTYLGIKPKKMKKDKPSTDKEALKACVKDAPIVEAILEYRRLKKALDALKDIRRETVDGYLHPFFNLNSVQSYRSSSDSINFQNQQTRDKEMAELIRSVIVPRPGHVLVENDFKGAEVNVNACYHKDPTMIGELRTGHDQHTEEAKAIYFLPPEWVSKIIRYCAKNKFVFPEYYGAKWSMCAQELWEACVTMKLALPDGTPLRKHLENNGITKLKSARYAKGDGAPLDADSFERHVWKLERRLWDTHYPVYRDWKEEWWEAYCKTGGFDLLSGFHCEGYYWKNEVVNFPAQGSAFHCLLWSFIELSKWLSRTKRHGSMLIGQIHDSIIGDIAKEHFQDYIAMTHEIMTVRLQQAWPWVLVPIPVEIEASEENWFKKSPVKE